ncbi:MAG: zinc-ribbon domain containing protein [Chloroflexi bacterium]|nr:zinc-ribbon domain containing protein [Chloroflexota bacterium]
MAYQDKTLTCRECGLGFTFTAREQEFYASKGFANEPVRCPECRAARKSSRSERGGGYGGSRESSPRQMYPAVCASCGTQTQVPFEPRTDRPVYCSDCFRKQRASRW